MSVFLKILFFVCDLLFLNLSIFFSFYFIDEMFWINERADYVYLAIYSNLAWLFLIMVSAPYSATKGWTLSKILRSQIAFIFIHLLIAASLISFFNRTYSLGKIGLIYAIFVPLFFFFRLLVFYLRRIFLAEIKVKNYILVGKNNLSFEIRKFFLLNPDSGYKFLGYFDYQSETSDFELIRKFCSTNDVHEIYCCLPDVQKGQLKLLVNFGLDSLIKVKLIFDSTLSQQQTIQLGQYDKLPGIDLATVALDDSRNRFQKRTFDLFFSFLFSFLFLSWLVPLIGLLIKMDSSGPIFFIQERNGEANKPFGCVKFRTMVVNNEADYRQATKDDARITKFGAFLRKSSIDELPQFLNVLKGDMSLIGPRPHPIKLNEKFEPLITNIMSRHYVKPGITGLAQCMGYRGETQTLADMENRVRLDRYYIENWTFWLDIKIIFLTVISLIRGSDKAY